MAKKVQATPAPIKKLVALLTKSAGFRDAAKVFKTFIDVDVL